jgi:leader peptidase (prepilin peptidase)/N-methyltransferase
MWVAALLGLGLGIVLNATADWMFRDAEHMPAQRLRILRWSALTLLVTSLCVYLQHGYGWNFHFVTLLTYCGLLLLIGVIDLEHRLVPDVLIALGMLLAAAFNAIHPMPGLAAALLGAALGGGVFLVQAVLGRGAMGAGDVKLAALIGMMTGFPWVMQALVLGIILGGAVAALLLVTRVRGRREHIPYAPYLVAGAIVTLLYGTRIAAWYAGLRGGKG